MRRISLLLFFCLPALLFAQVRPAAEDVVSLRSASAPQISPDGTSIAYVLTTRKRDADAKPSDEDKTSGWKTDRQLYLVPAAGGAPRQLTFAKERPSGVRWTPDGTAIAFLRAKKLHLLPVSGGEARPISTGDYEPQLFAFSPDGKTIAFTAEVPLSADEKKEKWERAGAKVFEGEWRNAYLFAVPAEGGEVRRVSEGNEHVTAFEWSPDGSRFALLTAESADPYFSYSLRVPKIISAKDGALVRQLETQPRALGAIRWSPDGTLVAYEKADQTLSLLNTLVVHDLESGKSSNAAAKLDPTLGGFVWSSDSRTLVAHVYEKTGSRFYRLASDGSSAAPIPFEGRVVRSDLSGSRVLAFNSATPTDPPDVTTLDLRGGAVRVVTNLNPEVKSWTLGKAEIVRWKSPEGPELEGVLTVTPSAEGVSPLMVLPHGGPDAVTSNDFSSWTHFFAAHGYSVFRPNYRGGFGYGRELYASNRNRLGEIEFMDIESGVDALIKSGKADPNRLVYGGWSWGGYLTTWTIGHTTRYRAAVVGAGVTDTVLQYALSDINHGAAAQWEFKGNPWLQPENFARANPLLSLAKIRTPTLIIHGEADERVPLPNAIVLYRALKDVGTPVRFLTYPGEPHGFENPAHTVHMLNEWLAWYRRHLPATATAGGRHLIYLHGRIVQEQQSARPRHPQHGYYEFEQIVETLRGRGLVVDAERRPKPDTVESAADRVVEKVRRLLDSGVPPDRITILGASMGASIAFEASAKLQNPDLRFVTLGACLTNNVTYLREKEGKHLRGRFLAIWETTDTAGAPCPKWSAPPEPGFAAREIVLNTGLDHGFIYRPLPEWVNPAVEAALR